MFQCEHISTEKPFFLQKNQGSLSRIQSIKEV